MLLTLSEQNVHKRYTFVRPLQAVCKLQTIGVIVSPIFTVDSRCILLIPCP